MLRNISTNYTVNNKILKKKKIEYGERIYLFFILIYCCLSALRNIKAIHFFFKKFFNVEHKKLYAILP